MRYIPQSLAEDMANGVTHLCWCWRIIRTDGVIFGFTDHDQDLVFDGLLCRADSGLSPGMMQSRTGFESVSAGTAGSVFHEDLSEQDLLAGRFDGARVEIWRVDWRKTDDRIAIWAGEIGEIKTSNKAFTAELLSNSRKLERTLGRTFAKNCDAQLGDARCQRDVSMPPFSQDVQISEVLSANEFAVDGLIDIEKNWFVFGTVRWLDAGKEINHSEIERHYSSAQREFFELLLPPKIAIEVGDQIRLTAGCNKSLEQCAQRFFNVENFRGCPFMPGNDAVLSAPFSD